MTSTAELQRIRNLYQKVLNDPESTPEAVELAERVRALDVLLSSEPDFPRDWIPF